MKTPIGTGWPNFEKPLTFEEVFVSSSLEVLEDNYWGPPTYPSHLVTTCHEIRAIPLNLLTIEHLRMAIGQPPFLESLPYLVPLAVQVLQDNPLAEGAFFEGDLLEAVLKRPDEYFEWDKDATSKVLEIAKKAEIALTAADRKYSSDAMTLSLISGFIEKHLSK